MRRIELLILVLIILASCTNTEKKELIEDSKLGFIDASVKSEDTNLKRKPRFMDETPGSGLKIERSFENAPPMIPHTTKGFFPIKINNNICLSCHLPEMAKETGAVELPRTHFTDLRPKIKQEGETFYFEDEGKLVKKELDKLNNSYFNCSQCHTPQADISIDIENLFTPEFRAEHGLEKSSLIESINEGI